MSTRLTLQGGLACSRSRSQTSGAKERTTTRHTGSGDAATAAGHTAAGLPTRHDDAKMTLATSSANSQPNAAAARRGARASSYLSALPPPRPLAPLNARSRRRRRPPSAPARPAPPRRAARPRASRASRRRALRSLRRRCDHGARRTGADRRAEREVLRGARPARPAREGLACAARCDADSAPRAALSSLQVHRSFEDNFWSTKMALPGNSIDGASHPPPRARHNAPPREP